jgi:uncharacterized protein (TIGR02117 family)
MLRRARYAMFALIALPLAYLATAVVLGLVPVNGTWRQPRDGIVIALRSNGFHAEIAVPIRTSTIDWALELYEPLVTYAGAPPEYVSFGWGDAEFYVATDVWRNMRLWPALSALMGLNGAVIHVEHIPGPDPVAGAVTLTVSEVQYARLVAYIRATFQRTDSGLVILATDQNFGQGDRFYRATGRYGPISTCNEWVRRALAHAGVRTARWAPFDWGVMWWGREMREW